MKEKLELPDSPFIVPLIGVLSGNDYSPNVNGYGISNAIKFLKGIEAYEDYRLVIAKFIFENSPSHSINDFCKSFNLAAGVFCHHIETILPPPIPTPLFTTSYLPNPYFQLISPCPDYLLKKYENKLLVPNDNNVDSNMDSNNDDNVDSNNNNNNTEKRDPLEIKIRKPARKFTGWTDEQYQMEVDPNIK